jgi:predicted HTH transcriptional regulator
VVCHQKRKDWLIIYVPLPISTSVEVIEKVFRETKASYPEKTVRELLANALIHQDLWQNGTHTMVEIFTDRMEITNPGTPLVDVNRFIDTPPKSRNEKIAILMHFFDLCELRGSGIDRAIEAVEKATLPAPKFMKGDFYTKVIIYSSFPPILFECIT